MTLRFANGIVNRWHSHLPATRGCVFSLGAFDGPDCVGVVIAGRPVARLIDDGRTLDVARLCTNGHANAASTLLGRARRVAQAMGFRRLISYTLASEFGTSYRAAGWTPAGVVEPSSWERPNIGRQRRADVVATQRKIRWEVPV